VEQLLSQIFACLTINGSEENEYVMKALMRVLSLSQDLIIPYVPTLVNGLTQKLVVVSKVSSLATLAVPPKCSSFKNGTRQVDNPETCCMAEFKVLTDFGKVWKKEILLQT